MDYFFPSVLSHSSWPLGFYIVPSKTFSGLPPHGSMWTEATSNFVHWQRCWKYSACYNTQSKNNKRKYKLLFIKIKNFCASKDTIKKMKRQLIKWEKMCTDQISDKESMQIYFKNSYSSTVTKWITQLNVHKEFKQTFHQRRHTDDQKAHEKMLNLANY